MIYIIRGDTHPVVPQTSSWFELKPTLKKTQSTRPELHSFDILSWQARQTLQKT